MGKRNWEDGYRSLRKVQGDTEKGNNQILLTTRVEKAGVKSGQEIYHAHHTKSDTSKCEKAKEVGMGRNGRTRGQR